MDLYWISECEVQTTNFRKFGYSQHLTYLVYEQGENIYATYWAKFIAQYPEVQVHFYRNDKLRNLTIMYQPVSRPYTLSEHWKAHPELEHQTILYMDSDVIFREHIDWGKYMQDDICYLSPTDYISATYFANKRKDVQFFKLEEYDKRDPLKELCDIVGVDKQVVIDNEEHTGGCQYLLKGITTKFWEKLMADCIALRLHAQLLNAEFFGTEDKGFQSWAIADMNGLLWNLWKAGKTVRAPQELGFSWSRGYIDDYYKYPWLHNAGCAEKILTDEQGNKHLMFFKSDSRFRTSSRTFFDVHEWGNVSTSYCSSKYLEAVLEVKNPVAKTDKLIY